MTIDKVKEILNERFNSFSLKEGIFTVKKNYYTGITQSGEKQADIVQKLIPNAKIIDYGNNIHTHSYFYVKFTVED